jgi:hypothetical protein
MKRLMVLVATVVLAGCQTMLDPNYALQLESYRLTITSQQNVEMAKARAEEARYNAIAAVAERADPASKQMAILALALSRGGEASARPIEIALPRIPESQEDRALKWAAVFAGPTTAIATGYFGYRLGQTQSNNQANTTIASYNALASFKPLPVDFTKIPPTTVTNTTTTYTNNNDINNRDGFVVTGGQAPTNPTQDNSTRPIAVVPPVFNTPVVVVPPVVPIVPVVTGP